MESDFFFFCLFSVPFKMIKICKPKLPGLKLTAVAWSGFKTACFLFFKFYSELEIVAVVNRNCFRMVLILNLAST